MPDNVKQEKKEQVDEKKENVNNKGKLQEEIDYDGYRKEMNENTHKAVKKSLDDIIKNIGKEVEKEKSSSAVTIIQIVKQLIGINQLEKNVQNVAVCLLKRKIKSNVQVVTIQKKLNRFLLI